MTLTKLPQMRFEIDWRDTSNGVACKTLASIALLIDETPVWPVTGGEASDFEWFADELLAHLTECWKPLILRQTYPIAVQPERPIFLMAEAAKRWSSLPDIVVESEQQEVVAFEDVHNLGNAFGGVTGLLPLWCLRDQDHMVIDTQETLSEVPMKAAIEAFTNAGNRIAERLNQADKEKWSKLLKAWKRRDRGDGTLLLALTIGRDKNTAATLIEEKVLEPPASFAEAANDNDELRMAARIAGPLPVYQIKTVIEKVRIFEPRPAPKLDETVKAARAFLVSELYDERPYVQGNELAKWLRGYLNIPAFRGIDPFEVLRYRAVDVRAIDLKIPSLDAIAVWGKKHGPGVVLNAGSNRFRGHINIWRNGAARITAAHEICHLLIDSEHALSAVDILGGRMPLRIEQRARAFAAEFMLPEEVAAAVWQEKGSSLERDGVERVIKMLCRKHGVAASTAAWQLEHGVTRVTPFHREKLAQILDQIAPQRWPSNCAFERP
jgi:Zn-dependent peptidase ImmA (M78 family)